MATVTSGSYKNIWHGKGRQRIEIPKTILKTHVLPNKLASTFFIGSLGYYPQAFGHYTYRKKGFARKPFDLLRRRYRMVSTAKEKIQSAVERILYSSAKH